MTTIKLSGGDLGNETMRLRCNLAEASSPIQADYGDGWVGTQYQCADTRHTTGGLIEIGKRLAARAVEMPKGDFNCEAEEYFGPTAAWDGEQCILRDSAGVARPEGREWTQRRSR